MCFVLAGLEAWVVSPLGLYLPSFIPAKQRRFKKRVKAMQVVINKS